MYNATSIAECEAGAWLRRFAESGSGLIDGRDVLVLVAHPDDETIGCGALLARLREAHLVVLTDGAPQDLQDAQRCGFATTRDYARARALELRNALLQAGWLPRQVTMFNVPDQQAALRLSAIARRLLPLLRARGIGCLLTHAYEGGHPDHDAAALVAHAAARALGHEQQHIDLVEMPFYRASERGSVVQQFPCAPSPLALPEGVTIQLDERALHLKRHMVAAYATQRTTMQEFDLTVERFRAAPSYDFTELPNEGRLLYEQYQWGLTGARWLSLARAFWPREIPVWH